MTTQTHDGRSLLGRYAARLDFGLLAALVIPLLAIMPLLNHAGLPNTADGPVHLMRQVELNQAWAEGNYYPRWGTDLALGHGMPIFSYAPPLLYQLTQLIHLAGLPLDESMKGVVVLDFLLYSVGMFLFARRVYGPYPALAAAAVYVYAPYRLREAFIQGNYGQFTGLAFYPLIFWAFHGLITEGRPRYWLLAPLSLAGLLFSHNISFMLFVPVFGAYLIFLIGFLVAGGRWQVAGGGWRVAGSRWQVAREQGLTGSREARRKTQKAGREGAREQGTGSQKFDTQHATRNTRSPNSEPRTPNSELQNSKLITQCEASPRENSKLSLRITHYALLIFRTILAGLLGLGLAAIFWLPAFGERHDIKLEGITQGFFDFRENFISLSEFLSPPLPLDLSAINPEFPLSLGLPQIAGAVLGLVALGVWLGNGLQVAGCRLQESRGAGERGSGDLRGAEEQGSRDLRGAGTYKEQGSEQARVSQFAIRNSQFATSGNSQLLHALFFAFFLLLYAYLALPYSQWLWESVPLLELAEFPWRMLGPAIFCASVLTAAGVSMVVEMSNEKMLRRISPPDPPEGGESGQIPPAGGLGGPKPDTRQQIVARKPPKLTHMPHPPRPAAYRALFITLLALFIVIAFNAHYLYPSQFIQWGTPTPADAFAYEVTSGAIGTTSTGEFLPRWAQQHPKPDTLRPAYAAGRPPQILDPAGLPPTASAETISYRSESSVIRIDTPQPFVATLRALYWPGWQLYLDGEPAPFEITPDTGLIQTAVPAGQHTLTLQLESTPLRTAGLWLSIVSAVALVVIVLWITLYQSKPTAGHWSLVTGHWSLVPKPKTQSPKLNTQNFYYALRITHYAFFAVAAFLLALYLLSRPLSPLFTLQSDPDQPVPADRHPAVDFGDQIRLVGVDEWREVIELDDEGRADLTVVLYWRALQELETNYSIFLHLDAGGQTLATVDEVSPENIPTRNWPSGLYLRNPLHLVSGAKMPPIRYNLTTGVYDRETGQRLPLDSGQETAYTLGPIWLAAEPPDVPSTPLATFGPHLTLHQAALDGGKLTLVWRTAQPITQNYSIFVHVLDDEGQILSQVDGVPYGGLYPLPHWRPGQLVEDVRPLDVRPGAATVALGVYETETGSRLPALDAAGQPLPNNSVTVQVSP